MPIAKVIISIITLIISGYLQFYASMLSLPVAFLADSDNMQEVFITISVFASANILVAGSIALIYSRFDHDSRLAAVLYILGALPLLIGGENVFFIGILALVFAISLFIHYYLINEINKP